MKNLIVQLLLICMMSSPLVAQVDTVRKHKNDISKNSIFVEFFGNGGLSSINYDRIVLAKKFHKVSVRGGVSFSLLSTIYNQNKRNIIDPLTPIYIGRKYVGDELYNSSLIVPLEVNYFFGKRYCLEIGAGLTGDIHLIKNLYGSRLYLFTRVLGFRYQRENGGFFFRAGLVPSFKIFLYKNEFLFDPFKYYFSYFSFDIGYTFKNKK
ncbi:MAG: hypothetical protein WCM76_04290 [Bacteroidota bacterium]